MLACIFVSFSKCATLPTTMLSLTWHWSFTVWFGSMAILGRSLFKHVISAASRSPLRDALSEIRSCTPYMMLIALSS
ncbi:hypothetical protein BDV18DRAFT_133842, partial [Aspergillus unguis]